MSYAFKLCNATCMSKIGHQIDCIMTGAKRTKSIFLHKVRREGLYTKLKMTMLMHRSQMQQRINCYRLQDRAKQHHENNLAEYHMIHSTNLGPRENIRDQLLVSFNRLARPSPHRRAKETKAATCWQYLPWDNTRNNTHYQILNDCLSRSKNDEIIFQLFQFHHDVNAFFPFSISKQFSIFLRTQK